MDIEIPCAVADEIASWRRVFIQRNGANPRDLLREASAEIWQVLEVDRAANPETNIVVRQAAVDALADMAEIGGIAPDDAQLIFAECFKPRAFNGSGKVHGQQFSAAELALQLRFSFEMSAARLSLVSASPE